MLELAKKWRGEMIEAIVAHDDDLMEASSGWQKSQLWNSCKKLFEEAVLANEIFPIVTGTCSVQRTVPDIALVLDAVVDYLLSPVDASRELKVWILQNEEAKLRAKPV